MLEQTITLLITALVISASPVDTRMVKKAPMLKVKETPQGHLVSVTAVSTPFESLLRDLSKQCRVCVTQRGKGNLCQPVSIHLKELPLEQAIKKILRAAGITSYLIRYSDRENSQSVITEVIIIGESGKRETAVSTAADEKQHELSGDLKQPAAAADEYSEKIASFKERYVWEDEETLKWAVYLLEAIPDEAKTSGLDCIIKELDKNTNQEKAAGVDEELFYRAIEAAAPPSVSPLMMKQVRHLSEDYKNCRAAKKADTACDRFYQDFTGEGR